jgi:hypothetical protein
MTQRELASYGEAVATLLRDERLAELGPGQPNTAVRSQLASLRPDSLFSAKVTHPDMAKACLAGLWLYHDFLDESHRISQELSSTAGSYWHAIMHRREPDFGNSKYWFRRVGHYPTFERLRLEAAALSARCDDRKASFLVEQTTWDPFRFVDLCESEIGSETELEGLCRKIQHCEWWLLFDDCYQRAIH